MNQTKSIYILIATLTILFSSFVKAQEEYPVIEIPLAVPFSEDNMEYSGMTWCDDKLVLLPQYPERFAPNGEPHLYAIEKNAIVAFLNGQSNTPLDAQPVRLYENDIRDEMMFFDGFEAIACDADTVWFSIEAKNLFGRYQAYVVPAERDQLNAEVPSISIRTDQIRYVESQSGMINKGDEAILLAGEQLISLHEINDPSKVEQPMGNRVHTKSGEQSQIPFSHLPYRLTDATAVDKRSRFWVINYKYSGDKFSRNVPDPLAQRYGLGRTHKQYYNAERLIEYRVTEQAISRTNRAPIQLELPGKEGRNWEGIERLENMGFLLVTDKHPKTILGFVAFDLKE